VIKYEEQFKARALQEQRAYYLKIGGPAFQRIVREQEMQQAQDVHEVASLESRFLGDRNDVSAFGNGGGDGHRKPTPFELSQLLSANEVLPPSEVQLLRALNAYPPPTQGISVLQVLFVAI
jgi:hypothetical protein